MPRIDAFLKIMQEQGASDLHLSAGSEPMLRINGILERARHRPLSSEELHRALERIYSLDFERFDDTVVSFLRPEDRQAYAHSQTWDQIRLAAVSLIEKVQAGEA